MINWIQKMARLWKIIVTLILILIVFLGMRFSFQSFRVEGSSMETSFHDGQYLLVNKLSYHFSSPKRGDVIIFHYPLNPKQLYIKRIVGLPGETVRAEGGTIYIETADGKTLIDPFPTPTQNSALWEVPSGYFVLGDNRDHSIDSRSGWTVPQGNIVGKVWFCYWPPGKWGFFPSYEIA